MSHMAAPRPSLKLPGMLDEPVGSLPLHLERPLPQPIARHLQERQKEREALIFCSLLTGVLHRSCKNGPFRSKNRGGRPRILACELQRVNKCRAGNVLSVFPLSCVFATQTVYSS